MFTSINARNPSRRPHHVAVFESAQWLERPVPEVFLFFSRETNLELLTPPWLKFRVVRVSSPQISSGTLIDYRLRIHGLPVRWRTRIEEWVPNQKFVDTQILGPYRYWHHTHTFEEVDGGTLMKDRVVYQVPLGILGRVALGRKIKGEIQAIFNYRSRKIAGIFDGARCYERPKP
jgi:uncharacterized protein